jgi:plastocyanin
MRAAIFLFVPLALVACGGGGGGNVAPAQINLTATSASPVGFTIPSGGEIDFVNKDTVSHQITSSDCSELNSPPIAAGAKFVTIVTNGPKTCNFTDTAGSHTFMGSFTVGPPGSPGNGY